MRLTVTFLMLLVAGLPLAAQTIRASLYGRVLDPQSSPVPNAKVRATHLATGTAYVFVTNENGGYDFPRLLQFGDYSVEAEAAGFQKLRRDGINLVIDQRAQVDLRLTVGSVSETVEVRETVPLLETSNATPGQFISNKQVQSLPLPNLSPLHLVYLAPGVSPQGNVDNRSRPGTNSTSNFSINGSRGVTNEMIVDGLSANIPEGGSGGSGTAGIVYYPSMEATEEVKVLNNTFSAEYGKSGGGVVTLTMKSGTNQFRGSVFEFFRNDKLDATPFFSNAAGFKKGALRQNTYGGAVGGPIVKNRTFFFWDYQAFRQRSTGQPTRSSLPTTEMGLGDFSNLRNTQNELITIYDPLTAGPGETRTTFPGNRIPAARMDPAALKIWSFIPKERRSAGDPFTALGNNTYQVSTPYDETQWDVKVDHNFSLKHHLMARSSRWLIDRDLPPTLPGSTWAAPNVADTGLWRGPRRSYQYVAGYTWTVSPTSIFDLRTGYTRYTNIQAWRSGCQTQFNSCTTPFSPTEAGLPDYIRQYSDAVAFPAITYTGGYQGIGVGNQQYWGPDTIALQATWTKVMGRHLLKAGFDGRRQHYIRGGGSDRAGQFNFSDQFTRRINNRANPLLEGNPFADFLLGTPTTGSISRLSVSNVKSDYVAFFLQDDFKVSSKLTLNLGVRYDVSRPMWDKFGQMSFLNPTVESPLNARIDRTKLQPGMRTTILGGLEFPGQGNLKNVENTIPVDWNNIAPRLGMAYQVNAKTVIRAGAGLLYKTQIGEAVPPPRESFSLTNTMISSADGARPTNYLRDPFPGGSLVEPRRGTQGLLTNLGLNASGIMGTNSNKVPYVMQWNVNVQRQLNATTLLEIGYSGNISRQFNRPPIDLNELEPQFVGQGNSLNELVPNPFFGLPEVAGNSVLARATVQRGQLLRPYPQFTRFEIWDYNGANASYHGGHVRVEKRFSQGLTLLGNVTKSKTMDDYSGIPTWLGAAPARERTRFDFKREWAVNEEDFSHRVTAAVMYELPVGKGKAFLNQGGVTNAVLGGWQMSSIVVFASGNPMQIVGGTPYHSFGAGSQRPNSTGVSAKLDGSPQSRLNKWFNTAQFTNPAPFTLGNVGRSLTDIRTDTTRNWDFTMLKVFPIWAERVKLEYRAVFTNFLNTPRFAAPERTFTSPDFGRVTRTSNGPREIQMGARLLF